MHSRHHERNFSAVPPPSSRPPAPHRHDFPHWASDTIRYGDLDRQNHVNNAVFSTYLETGRVMVLRDPGCGLLVPDTEFSLVRAVIDFRGELRWPGTIDIGTAIARVGTSSLTFAQAVFQGETCAASAQTTVVLVDAETRRPRPFPAEVAERIRASMPRAPGSA
jgi:acyl-CoA thioester hydrolase